MAPIPVVDLFAGPGGLNEGFCSLEGADGDPVFETAASFEMDGTACETLRLRSSVRTLRGSGKGTLQYRGFLAGDISFADFAGHPDVRPAVARANEEVHHVELGPTTREAAQEVIRRALASADGADGPWVLIGGPPCQAYSLVGRSRRRNDATFEEDVKHFLYREYLHIIDRHQPPVFVMENVKGLLSHTHSGERLFTRILEDLSQAGPGYDIRSFVVNDDSNDLLPIGLAPSDYVIRAENFGVPQRRHRVILLGVRSDHASTASKTLAAREAPTVRQVIGHLPRIRSLISPRRSDEESSWRSLRDEAVGLAGLSAPLATPATSGWTRGGPGIAGPTNPLEAWLTKGGSAGIVQHEARAHMPSDLQRYAFLAASSQRDPHKFVKVGQLPESLLPDHANARRPDAPFADRFRVQVWDRASTTVTSHIAKDGHYYIHPDPAQMRSLTVREAARLQTFPDDYFFCGNRTQQYHQVGNAVPPFLARQLAEVVAAQLRTTVRA